MLKTFVQREQALIVDASRADRAASALRAGARPTENERGERRSSLPEAGALTEEYNLEPMTRVGGPCRYLYVM